MKISENCIIHGMNELVYHADPCVEPSASRSFLQTLVSQTPQHAFMTHPRFNPDYKSDDKKEFDFGSAAHDYILEGGSRVEIIQFDDYRKDVAKEARDNALAAGKCPIIAHKFPIVEAMADAAKKQIAAHGDYPDGLTNGKPEGAIFWNEDGTWFRTKPDWIQNDDGWLEDYKTTGISGGPDQWIHGTFFDKGYDVQAYMGLRGYNKVTGRKAKGFRFWVQEDFEPYSVYCVIPDPLTLDIAEQKFFFGKMMFERCRDSGRWPGYSNKAYVAVPNFKAEKLYEEIKLKKQAIETNDGNMLKIMTDWQKPHERKSA